MIDLAASRMSALLVAALVILLHPLASASAAEQSRFTLSGINGGKAILSFAADPLVTMTPTPFHLILTDHTGAPLTGRKIVCDLDMPAMAMPENRPELREADGAYWGEALFTMAGGWRATFRLSMPDGRREILLFDLGRVLLK